ncbi:MAG: hypothetical protein ABR511_07280 [Acidimicrobiales bacterium]
MTRAGLEGRAGLVLVGGAVAYALVEGALGLTFDATPLLLGAIVLAAAAAGPRPGLTATGLALVGWGVAVLLVRHGPLPDNREAPAFLVGAGAGLVAASLLSRVRATTADLGSGALVLVLGGLAFYLAFDHSWVNDWPLWALVTAAWGAVLALRGPAWARRPGRRSRP